MKVFNITLCREYSTGAGTMKSPKGYECEKFIGVLIYQENKGFLYAKSGNRVERCFRAGSFEPVTFSMVTDWKAIAEDAEHTEAQ